MRAKHPDSIEWAAMRHAEKHADIRARVRWLIDKLVKESAEATAKHLCPCEVTAVEEDSVVATLSCPIGSGRIVLDWAASEQELIGQMIVQRSRTNELDQLSWEPVWIVCVGRDGAPFVETDKGRLDILPQHDFGDDYSMATFKVLLSMVCAIATGPQFE